MLERARGVSENEERGRTDLVSVFIQGMKMPESCSACPICYDDIECPVSDLRFWRGRPENDEFDYISERHPRCPLTDENELRIYGYPVRLLAEVAFTMNEKGISAYEAIDVLKNADEVAKMITEANERIFHEWIRETQKPLNPKIEKEMNEGWQHILDALEVENG